MTAKSRKSQPLDWKKESPNILLDRIRDAGIVGMGGAGFPTHLKFQATLQSKNRIVVANGVETDPGVTADKTLLRQNGMDVLEGVGIAARTIDASSCFLAVSDPVIANQLRASNYHDIDIVEVEALYQNGEERTLIEILTSQKIASNVYPAQCGILVLNVATLFAICEAVRDGLPVTKRVATVLGQDRWCEIGASVSELAKSRKLRVGSFANGTPATEGATLKPVNNAISINRADDALACIRCGWCDAACPKSLPVETLLNEAMRSLESPASMEYLNNCNDCGACVVACPSQIPIIDYIRESRVRENESRLAQLKANAALERFESKQRRMVASNRRTMDERERRMQQDHKWQ